MENSADSHWIITLSAYYHSLYLDGIKHLAFNNQEETESVSANSVSENSVSQNTVSENDLDQSVSSNELTILEPVTVNGVTKIKADKKIKVNVYVEAIQADYFEPKKDSDGNIISWDIDSEDIKKYEGSNATTETPSGE